MSNLVPIWKRQSLNNHLFNDFDRMVESFFQPTGDSKFFPACDIQESEKYLLLSFDLPGIKNEDLKIEIDKGRLSISGERKSTQSSDSKPHLFERRFGKFHREFKLPNWVETKNIQAEHTEGVLRLLVPKTAEGEVRAIEVKAKETGLLDKFAK